ncbi:hypothetical protein [Lentzea albida]|uniref:hypothetical protein n=1 Tax=Lentzea albida TaxID=65499 RepID=UPI001160A9E2|nr:hypothetical protein [Lentzea albida]
MAARRATSSTKTSHAVRFVERHADHALLYKKNGSRSTDIEATWPCGRYCRYGIVAADGTESTMKVRALDEDEALVDELTLQRR